MPKYLDEAGVNYLWNKIKESNISYKSKTTSEWDQDLDLIAQKNIFYIYEDYKYIMKDGRKIFIPGIKIGDGTSLLKDLPFTNIGVSQQVFQDHVNNQNVHISSQERDFWNNKLNLSLRRENLTFNRR